jgi:hypothetical protein
MVQTPKTIGNIPLDEPVNSLPSVYDLTQGAMTSPSWAKPMRLIAKGGFEVSVKELAHHLLHHL